MGDKRASVRTLPTGEKVRHLPPDELHPQGQLVLIRDHSPLGERIKARAAFNAHRHEQLGEHHRHHLAVKQQRQRVRGVPPEKRCV